MTTLPQYARRAATVLALAALLGACSHGPHHPGGHDVTLTGAQEVPANTSTASGSSTIRVAQDRSVSGGVRYTGMVATVAHIHEAPAGANGPVILAALLGACSHGPHHPGGHDVTLTGAQEVPANTSTASGSSSIRVAHDRSVSGGVRYTGMLATVAHIHEAPVGANGPVIVPLVKTTEGMFAVPAGGVRYTGMVATVAHIHEAPAGANGPVIVPLVKTAEGMFAVPPNTMLTPPQYASYQAGNLYVNVHSAAYHGHAGYRRAYP